MASIFGGCLSSKTRSKLQSKQWSPFGFQVYIYILHIYTSSHQVQLMTPYRNWNGSQKDATFQRSYSSGIPFFKLSFVEIVQDPIGVTIVTSLGFDQPNSPIGNQYEINGKKLGSMLLFISRTIFQTIQIHE